MTTTIVSNPAKVLAFVNTIMPLPASAGMKGLGVERDGELIAGVVYEGYNGHNVWMHVAAKPDTRWLNRSNLEYFFSYPFLEMKVKRVSAYVEASNTRARRFDESLGFRPEATLKGAASDGGDVIVYVMRKEDCRYVPLAHH